MLLGNPTLPLLPAKKKKKQAAAAVIKNPYGVWGSNLITPMELG